MYFLALFIDIDLVKLNHHSSPFSGQHKIRCGIVALACLFNLIMSQSTIFPLCRDWSSWFEPVLSKDKCVLLKDTTQ